MLIILIQFNTFQYYSSTIHIIHLFEELFALQMMDWKNIKLSFILILLTCILWYNIKNEAFYKLCTLLHIQVNCKQSSALNTELNSNNEKMVTLQIWRGIKWIIVKDRKHLIEINMELFALLKMMDGSEMNSFNLISWYNF